MMCEHFVAGPYVTAGTADLSGDCPIGYVKTTPHYMGVEPSFIQYEHHGRMVWVRASQKGQHWSRCLCGECAKFTPNDRENNCPIANALYAFDVERDLVTPVWECPKFEARIYAGRCHARCEEECCDLCGACMGCYSTTWCTESADGKHVRAPQD